MTAEPKLTEAEKVPLLQAYAAGPIAMLYAVQDIVAAREAAARREALLEAEAWRDQVDKTEAAFEAERRALLSANLERRKAEAERATWFAENSRAQAALGRVRELVKEWERPVEGRQEYATLAFQCAADEIRAALAEPECDEEGGND